MWVGFAGRVQLNVSGARWGPACVAVASVCALILAPIAAGQATSGQLSPVSGAGSATSTGVWGNAQWPYDATLTTNYSPSEIVPGEGFTFTATNVRRLDWTTLYGTPSSCTAGPGGSSDDDWYQWYHYKADPGKIMWDGPLAGLWIAGAKTEHIVTGALECPYETEIRTLSHAVSGAATAALARGCYQSITTNAGYDWPLGGAAGNDNTHMHLAGTVSTLSVGSIDIHGTKTFPDCLTVPLDEDHDGVPNETDNCRTTPNPHEQGAAHDDDEDGIGDACDSFECMKGDRYLPLDKAGIDACGLEKGDILLDRGSNTDALTLAEGGLGGTYWTHAALVLGYLDLDATDATNAKDCSPDAVRARYDGGEGDPGCELVIGEARPNIPHDVRIMDYLKAGFKGWLGTEYSDLNAVRLTGLSTAQRNAAANYLLNYLLSAGTAGAAANHYTAEGVWNAAPLDYSLLATARGPDEFYCSSLVWWAFKSGADVDLDRNFELSLPVWGVGVATELAYVTPDNLIQHEDLAPSYLATPAPNGLVLAVLSPAHIMLIDDLGRGSGMDGAGQFYDEIPGAIWRDNGLTESISTSGTLPGLRIRLSGYETGKYTLYHHEVGAQTTEPTLSPGFTRPGQVETFSPSDLDGLQSRPVAVDDDVESAPVGTDIDPLANDFNAHGARLTVTVPPAHGTATVGADGRIHYAPAGGYAGNDQLTYRICGAEWCTEAHVHIVVLPSSGGPGGVTTTTTGATPPPSPTHAPVSVAINSIATLPPSGTCSSRRKFLIRLRGVKARRIVRAQIRLNGRQVRNLTGKALGLPVVLRGLPKGKFTVQIVTTDANGKTLVGKRTYRSCAPRRR